MQVNTHTVNVFPAIQGYKLLTLYFLSIFTVIPAIVLLLLAIMHDDYGWGAKILTIILGLVLGVMICDREKQKKAYRFLDVLGFFLLFGGFWGGVLLIGHLSSNANRWAITAFLLSAGSFSLVSTAVGYFYTKILYFTESPQW